MSTRCRLLRRHRWSAWSTDAAFPGSEYRMCQRCGHLENRPRRPAGEAEPVPPRVPVHEPTDYAALEAGHWPRDAAAQTPKWVIPPEFFDGMRTHIRHAQVQLSTPVIQRAQVVPLDATREISTAAGNALAKSLHEQQLQAMHNLHGRQLEAMREMLADLGRQLDEVTHERDDLARQAQLRLPPDVVGIKRDLDAVRDQLEHITGDRDRLAEVSGRRIEHIRALLAQLTAARSLVLAGAPNSDILGALKPPPELGNGWHDEHPVRSRPNRC